MSAETMTTRSAVRRWTHVGLDCAMIESGIGFVNGYVRLPSDHLARNASYDQINRTISVHGGLTYGPDDEGWTGFDTGHSGDYWPGSDPKYRYGSPDRTWSIESLAVEVESLASQLSAMTEIGQPESHWDCTESEFDAILRDAMSWRAHLAEVTP